MGQLAATTISGREMANAYQPPKMTKCATQSVEHVLNIHGRAVPDRQIHQGP